MKATSAIEKTEDVVSALDALRTRLASDDRDAVEKATSLIQELKSLVTTLDGQLAAMKWLAQKQFRPKTEKMPPGQLALDLLGFLLNANDSGDAPSNAGHEAPLAPVPAVPERSPREKRRSNLHLLPVVPVDKRVAEVDRVCPHCEGLKSEIGHEPRRHLVYEPPKLFFREERLFKYACRKCMNGVQMAKATPKLIAGSNVASSLLSHLVVSKVVDAVPIERVGKQLSRHGADLASSTLHEWFGRCSEEVSFIKPLARKSLLDSHLISLDDSPLPAKVVGHANGTQRGRLWLYIGDLARVGYCEFTPDWKGAHPQSVLADFRGQLQSDGYGGLHPLFKGKDPPGKVGCNDHARRKFVEAMKLGDKRAERVIALYGALYTVEREVAKSTADERLAVRQARSVPLWRELSATVLALEPKTEPKSPLGKAVTYFRRQHDALSAYLDDGLLPISNAHVERLLRSVALFRKNSLFVGSLEAGDRYAVLLTLAINCALCGANPFAYFNDLFDRVADGWPAARALELMPQAWLAAQQQPEQTDA